MENFGSLDPLVVHPFDEPIFLDNVLGQLKLIDLVNEKIVAPKQHFSIVTDASHSELAMLVLVNDFLHAEGLVLAQDKQSEHAFRIVLVWSLSF